MLCSLYQFGLSVPTLCCIFYFKTTHGFWQLVRRGRRGERYYNNIWFILYRYNYNTRVIRSLEVAEEVIRGTPHCFRNDLAEARTRTNKNMLKYFIISEFTYQTRDDL